MSKIFCYTGSKNSSTYYDAYFLQKYSKSNKYKLMSGFNNLPDIDRNILFTDPGVFCSVAPKFIYHKNKVVCWWHGDKETKNKGVKKRLPIASTYLPNCKKIVVSCDHGYNAVLSLGVNTRKIHRIPLGVDLTLFKEYNKINNRKKYSVPQDAFCIGSFQRDTDKRGGPKWIKGPDIFVDVINKIKNKIPNLFVLLSARRRRYVKKRLCDMKVPCAYHLVDFHEMPYLYSCLDCYLMTSRVEGGPKSLMESVACGKPIVATNCGMTRDVIRDGINGFVVPQEDSNLIAEKVLQIYMHGLQVNIDTVSSFDYKSNIVGMYDKMFDTL